MCIDVDRCIGCGLCVDACKTENRVPEAMSYFRTWVERYIIKKPASGSLAVRGEVLVDSPNGGRDGFPPSLVPRDAIMKSFFVPKLCNLCEHSPCVQACPVGATFEAPDGVVLVDPDYCIGCGFCIQACPYGCRFLHPETKVADKCTLCSHRIPRAEAGVRRSAHIARLRRLKGPAPNTIRPNLSGAQHGVQAPSHGAGRQLTISTRVVT